ncbi:MAG: hypothetical protein JWL62_1985 [Hyphomicrobiales bacterium]|nr:hypothetical protein [Hyphomicrobiales bacterium]
MAMGESIAGWCRSILHTTRSGLDSARRLRPSALVNGITVSVGVAVITVAGEAVIPLHAASLMLGAICASVADVPATVSEKLRRIGLAWVLSAFAMLIAASAAETLLESVIVMAVGFCAAMVTAYGRPALPISVSILLALALTSSAIPPGQPVFVSAGWFAVGGICYALYAVLSTPLLMRHTKRLLVQEALRAVASYLRVQKAALDPGADKAVIYGRLIDAQAMLAERIQAARNVVFVGLKTPQDRQIAAELLVGIDIFEAALAEQADLDALLEMGNEDEAMLRGLRGLLLIAASDLSRLSRAVVDTRWQGVTPIGDRALLFERIGALQGAAPADQTRAAVLRATTLKLTMLFQHIDRLRKAQADAGVSAAVIGTIDLEPFVQRSMFPWSSLKREFSMRSPVMRFAIRLSLAMFCGSAIGLILPYRAHGSWILLTVALVMRSNYSVTRQRRRERLLGNIIGCVLAAIALRIAPASFAPLIIFVAVGAAHAFALQSYLVASAASCITALMQIHIAEPGDDIFFLMRIVDTALGATLAYGFSFLLPHWEHQTISGLVPDLLRAERACARAALTMEYADQAYRLARRRLFDTIAALSTATSRMLEEPASARHNSRALSEFLAAGYVFAAELASVQVFLRSRDVRDPQLAEAVTRAGQVVDAQLEAALAGTRLAGGSYDGVVLPDVDSLESETYEGAGRLARRLRRVIQVAGRVSRLGVSAGRPEAAQAAVEPK